MRARLGSFLPKISLPRLGPNLGPRLGLRVSGVDARALRGRALLTFLVKGLLPVTVLGLVLFTATAPVEAPVVEVAGQASPTLVWPVFYVKTEQKAVALTFDISWGTKTPYLVLPVLERTNQKATFFLSGPWTARNPEIAKAIAAAGHEIGSHGDRHDNLSTLNRTGVEQNISKAHADLKQVMGLEPRFFRPPNGDYDDIVVDIAKTLGYETIIWSVDSLDWKNPGVSTMISRVTKLAFPGAIILFHASDSSRETHLALPETIQTLRDAGYKIVTLGELWKMGTPGRDDPRGRPTKN